ncbi:phenylalanine--tRNA ligase subunit beta [Geobacter grbiciae]|uniref:phenylalanine--tRNA ligase subunit beta n=1 Tax=Geobacter grbiciae TaxID=155042 RepID=UPI001C027962|nr:phenylalanine--tRNA ligase subunit beta [Geobacter grbiciae]MBT1076711.1 phenylalanine--tRNA ligase subunit beta [Geobacter grbiciae]
MIVTYNWLKEFVDFDLSPQELSDLLTMLGLEVEGVRHVGGGLDEVVVAVVEERSQHPNADKLSLCRVNNGKETLAIVCGAQNFKAGDKVALAQIGAVLPGDFKIKRSKIRGEESCGMLCSEKELGLAAESEGIIILPTDLPLGVPVFDALGLKDTIFEIGLTPNRADCLSVVGIAREIAAKLGTTVKYARPSVKESDVPISERAQVIVEDSDLCPRYTARYIAGCSIGPSPAWLVRRLEAVGMRSINNVVDVTNYVLMEYGHPLHAFDADLLAGGKIVVRRAAAGERFTTLDGQERVLTEADLTIRDGEKGVALAGIMGGENSEIRQETSNILLESAYFNPSAIRRTSKRLGLHTESSHRFERGADVDILVTALDRAASLIAELAGGRVATGTIDVYPRPLSRRTVRFRVDQCNRLLGIQLTADEMAVIFNRLEFKVNVVEPELFDIDVPSCRVDIEREIDLVEEVARLNGYNNIPVTMPKARVFSDRPTRHQRLEKQLRNVMVGQGFSEVITFSFMAPGILDKLLLAHDDPSRSVVRLRNPLVEEQSVMRTTLLPGLLDVAARNINYRMLTLRLFELRRVYLPAEGQELPREPLHLAGIMTGVRYREGWNQERHQVDFYDVKGVIEHILDEFAIGPVAFVQDRLDPYFHPGKACSILCGNELLGSFGELHPDIHDNFGIDQSVYYLDLDFEKLAMVSSDNVAIKPPSRFPDTFRDIAILIKDETPASTIVECISGLRIREVECAEIFDHYKGSHVPEGFKSIAVRIRYRSHEKTLVDNEVTPLHQRIVDTLVKKLAVTIR